MSCPPKHDRAAVRAISHTADTLAGDGPASFGGRRQPLVESISFPANPAFFATIPDEYSGETAGCYHVNQYQQLADSPEPRPEGRKEREVRYGHVSRHKLQVLCPRLSLCVPLACQVQ